MRSLYRFILQKNLNSSNPIATPFFRVNLKLNKIKTLKNHQKKGFKTPKTQFTFTLTTIIVFHVLTHSRIGCLERQQSRFNQYIRTHSRIGCLETSPNEWAHTLITHSRIGCLEKAHLVVHLHHHAHSRIGC